MKRPDNQLVHPTRKDIGLKSVEAFEYPLCPSAARVTSPLEHRKTK